MKRKEMQLLVENWRSFVNNPKSLVNNRNAMNSNIIIESRSGYFNGTFANALNEVKRGNIGSELLIEVIVNNLNKEIMLNESVFDTLKKWAASGKSAVTGAVKAAMEKVNEMYEKATLQIWNVVCLGKIQIQKLERPLKSLNDKAEKLRTAHPKLFLMMKILIIMMVLIAIITMSAPEAQAKISGAEHIDVKVAVGYLKSFVNGIPAQDFMDDMEGNMKKVNDVREAALDLIAKFESKKTYAPDELQDIAQFALKKAKVWADSASESGSDSEDYAWVKKLWKMAKASLSINNIDFPKM